MNCWRDCFVEGNVRKLKASRIELELELEMRVGNRVPCLPFCRSVEVQSKDCDMMLKSFEGV